MIEAKDKDGTPAQIGAKVFAVWDSGLKSYGYIARIGEPRRFFNHHSHELLTYSIRCRDGVTRPAHARHIKFVNPRR